MTRSHETRRGKRQPRAGNMAIEFAILAPVFLVILLGMVQIGFAARESMHVQNAAEAGADYAVKNGWDEAGVNNAAVAASNMSGLSATSSDICGCPGETGIADCAGSDTCADGSTASEYVRVDTSAPRTDLFPGVTAMTLGLPATLHATAIVRIK